MRRNSTRALRWWTVRVLVVLVVSLGVGCGAQLDEDRTDGSNFNPTDFKKTPEPVRVLTQPQNTAPAGPRDPDGLLHRIAPELHGHLSEVRLSEDNKVLVIFRSGEAIKLEGDDLTQLTLVQAADGVLLVRVRTQDFKLKLAP